MLVRNTLFISRFATSDIRHTEGGTKRGTKIKEKVLKY